MSDPFYADRWLTAYEGDARAVLAEMPPESVHCVLTSPPYYGLRDYEGLGMDWGDWSGQLGDEPNAEQYIGHLMQVCEAVRRVLRSDGSFWLNMGDSYGRNDRAFAPAGGRAKNLLMMPARVALALQAAGWYLRSDIIWYKTNATPESVRDRPTKSHEHIFMLTRSQRYYFDGQPVRQGPDGSHQIRDVWAMPTEPYPGSHFAVMPEGVALPCVRAGSPARGVCATCGAPWKRVLKRTKMVLKRSDRTHSKGQTRPSGAMVSPPSAETVGWVPTCEHEGEAVPAVVLDPFAGTGTTAIVARRYLRRAVMIDQDGSWMRDRLIVRAEYETEVEARVG